MGRIETIDPKRATGPTKELLDGVQRKIGMVPQMMRAMATSPATLGAYLAMGEALGTGKLDSKLREQIALTTAEANGCDYCLAAHSAIGKSVGLSAEQIAGSRRAASPDRRVDAALKFAEKLVEAHGWADDEDMQTLRQVGYDDGEIGEIIANVAHSLFSNYFNHVAEPAIDFPPAAPLRVEDESCTTATRAA